MQRINIISGVSVVAIAVLLCSCSSDPKNTKQTKYGQKNQVTYGREELRKQPINFPPNYNTDNFRKLVMAVDFGNTACDGFSPEIGRAVNTRMQSEMAKIKRFSVFAVHGQRLERIQALADVGQAKLAETTDMKDIAIMLSGNILMTLQRKNAGRKQVLTYGLTINITCTDLKTGLVKFSKDIDAKVNKRQTLSSSGRVIAGFNANNQKDIEQVFMDVVVLAAMKLANELGNSFPVGGRITGMLDETLTLDKGFEQGVGGKMQMVVFTQISGVDLPLALAEASPGTNTSNLQIWRWNTDNQRVQNIRKQMQDDSAWLEKNKLYAVGYGMAKPSDWDKPMDHDLDDED